MASDQPAGRAQPMVGGDERLVRPLPRRRVAAVEIVGAELLAQSTTRSRRCGRPARFATVHHRVVEVAVVHEPAGSLERRRPLSARRDRRARQHAPLPPAVPKLPPVTASRGWPVCPRVMTLTVPPKASAPKSDEPGPCSTSIRSTASSGTGMSPLWWPGLRVVQPHAVHEHEHLPEAGAADRKVALDAAHTARAHVHRRHQPQHVGH